MSMPMNTGRSAGQNMTGSKMSGDIIPKGMQKGQLQNFPPEAMELWKSLFPHLGPESFLGKLAGGDQSQFEQLEAPAMRQFQGFQGQLASRFSGMGSGARHSSGFKNTMNQATQDFAGQLQAQRMGLQSQAIKDLMGMSNNLLNQRPYDQFLTEKPQSFWQKLLSGGAIGSLVKGGTAGATMYGLNKMNQSQASGQSGAGGGQDDMMKMAMQMLPFIL